MAEISVQFSNQLKGYDKTEVDQFVKDAEAKLQEKAVTISELQQQVAELEGRLTRITGTDASVEEKVELYDKLMKKMDGDYKNLLAPAIAKAKAIEAKAESEYQIRMDQARYTAEGIYKETADRIADVVDANMDRIYDLIGEFIYSKTLPGRIKAFLDGCRTLTEKVTSGATKAAKASGEAFRKVKDGVQTKYVIVKERIASKLTSNDADDQAEVVVEEVAEEAAV